MGNTVVAIPSERAALAATDLYSVLETSDVPDGVINIVTGAKDVLALSLAEHDDVDAVWYHGSRGGRRGSRARVGIEHEAHVRRHQRRSTGSTRAREGQVFLREATQVKNIWIPYGE